MKISVLGMGHVGGVVANGLVVGGLADELVVVSRDRGKAEGEAMDLNHAVSFVEKRCAVRGGGIEDMAGSDVVILTAGVGMEGRVLDRRLMAKGNVLFYKEVVRRVAEGSPRAVVVVVTNPVDVMTWWTLELSGFEAGRVIGSGTLIDSARFRWLLSGKLGIHADDLRAYILGEHGEGQFAAMSGAMAGGVRMDEDEEVREIARSVFEEAKGAGNEIMRRKGHTDYAIGAAVGLIVEAIVKDTKRTMPVSTLVDGYCGVEGVCLSLPCVIGRGGVEKVLRPGFDEGEVEKFREAGRVVRGVIEETMAV